MPARGTNISINYTAWDFTNNVGKTGDGGNHTLKLIRDGIESSPSGVPFELDFTNAPGVYGLTLTASEMSAAVICICGKSSTAGVSIIPIRLVTS